MLFPTVIVVSILGAILLGAGLVLQKGRETIDLSPRSLLRLYLYVASLAGVIVLAGGVASLLSFALAGPLGRDVVYGAIPTFSPTPVVCPAGAPECAKGIPGSEEQRARATAERDRRVGEDLIRGITFSAFGAIFFVAHWLARRGLGFDEPRSLLLRAYLMLGTLAFGIATVFMLPSGITTAASNALLSTPPDTYRQAAGESLGGGLVSLAIWLIYLRMTVRDFRSPAA